MVISVALRTSRPLEGVAEENSIVGRFQDLMLSPGDPTAATHEPDSASYDHLTYGFSLLCYLLRGKGGRAKIQSPEPLVIQWQFQI
jgi:hypothetical protein